VKLLQIDSSARGSSVSRQLTKLFVEAWKREHPDGEVVLRDLATTFFPLITDEWQQAAAAKPEGRSEAQRQILSLSETLIDELISAQTIVIGAPMHNFAISSVLKAWIDQIVRPGRTLMYGPDGAKGLLTGKKVVVLTARGGMYSKGSPRAAYDYQEPYLRTILAYVGLTDVTFIHAENQQRRDQAQQSRQAASEKIAKFVTPTQEAVALST
jgi:FMN-dependent NADH-azoreductase